MYIIRFKLPNGDMLYFTGRKFNFPQFSENIDKAKKFKSYEDAVKAKSNNGAEIIKFIKENHK